VTPRRRVISAFAVIGIALSSVASSPPALAATSVTCPASPAPINTAQQERVWSIAATRLAALAGPATLPFGATGRSPYLRTSAYAWTSGFYPAALWLMYEHTADATWLERAEEYTERVLPVASWRGTHDLGFMVGLPAGLASRIDPSPQRRTAYLSAQRTAARSLSARWNRNVQALRSSSYAGKWGVIIDSAMNAPLLIEVGQREGGAAGTALVRRGTQHMLTLARAFVRNDGSTRHRLAFNPRTGAVTGPIYGQGLSTASTWARGQSWAVNGFAQSFALTGDARLLTAARLTSDYWMSHVPAGCIPAWDLDVTDDAAPRDSSAAAITADGLLILAKSEPDPSRAEVYRTYALATLGTLASAPWTVDGGRGVLQRQAYNVPSDAREGTYAWGDTYLLHALAVTETGAE
jgi:unsaturated chondroitin disaccharide hydrolase